MLTRLALGTLGPLLVAATLASADDTDIKITSDVIYGHKAGMALTYDVLTPAKPNGAAVLFMMSGGWVSTWFPSEVLIRDRNPDQNQFYALLQAGYTLIVVRHGSSPYFKVPDAVADVRRAVRHVRQHAAEYGVDPERLGVTGGSAGGHLSLMLGTTADNGIENSNDPLEHVSNRVKVVVSIFPPTKIDEFFKLRAQFPALQFDDSLADSVSPLLHVTSDDAPSLLISGDADTLVPVSNSERIVEAFQGQGVPTELVVIKGAGHGFQGQDNTTAIRAMLGWFDKYLAQ